MILCNFKMWSSRESLSGTLACMVQCSIAVQTHNLGQAFARDIRLSAATMTNRLGRAKIALPDVVMTVVAFAMAALVVDAVPPTAQQPVLEWSGGARSDWINVLSNDISNCKVRFERCHGSNAERGQGLPCRSSAAQRFDQPWPAVVSVVVSSALLHARTVSTKPIRAEPRALHCSPPHGHSLSHCPPLLSCVSHSWPLLTTAVHVSLSYHCPPLLSFPFALTADFFCSACLPLLSTGGDA
jgi:hypothetical protein